MSYGSDELKSLLYRIEKQLKKLPGLALLKWMNKETPLLFLLVMWLFVGAVILFGAYLKSMGLLGADDYNVWLSWLALLTTFILSIVVVL